MIERVVHSPNLPNTVPPMGPLHRWSPFPQASQLRNEYGDKYIPGCQAEALLLSIYPELGPTTGPVLPKRANQILDCILDIK